ncbi:hypothetical protein WN55_10622 [Dufourea novaeangliae]|uniref:Uncharacterized protein n=1 Tax=Dufourea novaeangliae TaxID=178035 RepID=A0A154P676_DUFNO|nr:hypothetical protein WN55_10622 [Dufourea novaeangliae]
MRKRAGPLGRTHISREKIGTVACSCDIVHDLRQRLSGFFENCSTNRKISARCGNTLENVVFLLGKLD